MLSSPSFKRFYKSTDVRFHFNLIHLQRFNLIRYFANRWQVVALDMRSFRVVVFGELGSQIIKMSLTKYDELGETFEFDRFDESFTPAVQIRGAFR